MIINFQQGIISYPVTGSLQSFLTVAGGFISLNTANGRVDVTFAHGSSNYLFTETADVTNAWGPIAASTDTWLYWDLDPRTTVRTFGMTVLQPLYGLSLPTTGTQDQHYFVTTENKMYVYDSGAWRNVIRVFAAKVHNSTFTPLGSGFPLRPYAGTQVGVTTSGTTVGRILIDDSGKPIRRTDGRFFTTEDDIFANGSPVNTIRFEANVLTATALENLSRYQVVYFSQFGKINIATYDVLQEAMIAMLMEDLTTNSTGTVITQGTITNPSWNFATVGAPLWVDGTGVLVEIDPHVVDNVTYPIGKPPIARVVTPNTIFFDQGLGGKGDKGDKGTSADVAKADNIEYGIVRLNIPADDETDPIAVGTNDPRLTDPRAPLAHNHPATDITFQPYLGLTDENVQLALQSLYNGKVNVAGDTMTGYLTLNANPTLALHAAPKQYVDAVGALKLNITGGTMTGDLILNADPTVALGAATKQYVDNKALDDLTDVILTTPAIGEVLSFNGTEWVNSIVSGGTGSPAGNNTEIQYNDGGVFGASSNFTYDAITGGFAVNFDQFGLTQFESDFPTPTYLFGANSTDGIPGGITIQSGVYVPLGKPTDGGEVFIGAGDGSSGAIGDQSGSGGPVSIVAGNGGITGEPDFESSPNLMGNGGGLYMTAGDGGSNGTQGESDPLTGGGGEVTLRSGNGGFGYPIAEMLYSGTTVNEYLYQFYPGGPGGNMTINTGDVAPGGMLSGTLDIRTGGCVPVSWWLSSPKAEPSTMNGDSTGGLSISTGSCSTVQAVRDISDITPTTVGVYGGESGSLLIETGTGGTAIVESASNTEATGPAEGGNGGTIYLTAGQGGMGVTVDGPAVGGNGGNIILSTGDAGSADFVGAPPDSMGTGTAVYGEEGEFVLTAGRQVERPRSGDAYGEGIGFNHYRYYVSAGNMQLEEINELYKNAPAPLHVSRNRRITVDSMYLSNIVTWVVRGKYMVFGDNGAFLFESGDFGATVKHSDTGTTTISQTWVTTDVSFMPTGSELFEVGFDNFITPIGTLPTSGPGIVVAVTLPDLATLGSVGGPYTAVANVDILEFIGPGGV